MKYIHLRNKDYHGNILKHGGVSVGYMPLDKEGKRLVVTFARCSESDVFNRAKARMILEGRLRVGKFVEIDVPEGRDRYATLVQEAMKHEQAQETFRKAKGIKHKTVLQFS